jgi:hypothetical protein
MGSETLDPTVRVEVIAYVPTNYQHCKHCEVTFQIAGLGRKVHQDQLETGLPDDLYREFHRLSGWAQTLPGKFGQRVSIRLVDAASIEGFFKSVLGRFHRYPAFTVGGERYVGCDFSRVDAMISARLSSGTLGRESGSGMSTIGA